MNTYLIVTEETTAVQYMEAAGFSDLEIANGNREWGNRHITWVRVIKTDDNHEAIHDVLQKAEETGNVRCVDAAIEAEDAQDIQKGHIAEINKHKNIAYVAETGEILISEPKPKPEKPAKKSELPRAKASGLPASWMSVCSSRQ